jgi:hypothetical protein
MRGWSRGPALCPRPSAESLRRGCVLSQPRSAMSVMRRPCRAIDRSRGARGTARVAGLTQEFRRDHFEVARRDLLVALCRSGHRTRSSAHVWTCSARRDRPPCWIRAAERSGIAACDQGPAFRRAVVASRLVGGDGLGGTERRSTQCSAAPSASPLAGSTMPGLGHVDVFAGGGVQADAQAGQAWSSTGEMLMISLACHGEGAVAAVETEVAPTGHCYDLTIPGSRRSRVHPST